MIHEPCVVTLITGPAGHGAVRHARSIAAATDSRIVGIGEEDDEPIDLPPDAIAHVHYTDRLFGADAATAAARFTRLTARLRDRLVVTLHDVPLIDGSAHGRRRAAAYRRVGAAARAVIVASCHERQRLARLDIASDVSVIPLPIVERSRSVEHPRSGRPTVGVLGFVYPGKGHRAVIDATAELDVRVLVIGTASPGHDELLDELQRQAKARGCSLDVTGHVPDDDLDRWLARVDVPVVPTNAPSASSSLAHWIGAGRRPLAAVSDYTDEIAAVGPDLLIRYRPDELQAALGRAVHAPSTTRRRSAIPVPFRMTTVADRHLATYARVAGDRQPETRMGDG